MTTLIAKNGELYGDRRKVVNSPRNGIVGVRDDAKIYKLPFCLYGMTGWDYSDGGILSKRAKALFEQKLAVISALDYFTDEQFIKHPLHAMLKEMKYHGSFISFCKHFRNLIGRYLAKDLSAASSGLILVTRGGTFVADSKGWDICGRSDTIVVGAGSKMAAILLDHNVPIKDIYYALRAANVPSGTIFDKFTIEEDTSGEFPPVFGEPFLSALYKFVGRSMVRESVDNKYDEMQQFENHEKFTMFVAALLSLGKMDGNTAVFTPNPNLKIDDPEFRHTEIWKKACKITHFDFAKEPK